MTSRFWKYILVAILVIGVAIGSWQGNAVARTNCDDPGQPCDGTPPPDPPITWHGGQPLPRPEPSSRTVQHQELEQRELEELQRLYSRAIQQLKHEDPQAIQKLKRLDPQTVARLEQLAPKSRQKLQRDIQRVTQ